MTGRALLPAPEHFPTLWRLDSPRKEKSMPRSAQKIYHILIVEVIHYGPAYEMLALAVREISEISRETRVLRHAYRHNSCFRQGSRLVCVSGHHCHQGHYLACQAKGFARMLKPLRVALFIFERALGARLKFWSSGIPDQ